MADAELQKVVVKYLQSGCKDQGGYSYRLCRDEQDLILQKEFLLQVNRLVPESDLPAARKLLERLITLNLWR